MVMEMATDEPLRLLSQKYTAEILAATTEPKTAQELSDEFDIPIATCHRRLRQLCEHGLMRSGKKVLVSNQRRAKTYVHTVKGVHITFDGSVGIEFVDETDTETHRNNDWDPLAENGSEHSVE
jgi:predicted ArsR family transcriptional regulator